MKTLSGLASDGASVATRRSALLLGELSDLGELGLRAGGKRRFLRCPRAIGQVDPVLAR